MPNRHDNQTLINSIEHLFYEMQMFLELTFTETHRSIHVQFAILESWLIHLRSIDDMLRGCGKRDDILISDFKPHEIPPLIDKELRMRINKEIAHITSERVDFGPRKYWDRIEIFSRVWPGVDMMISLLETWLVEHDPSSAWRLELVVLRARGSQRLESVKSRSGYDNMDVNTAPHKLLPLVTYTVSYLPSHKSTSNDSSVFK
jgi:hypothetical protein